MKHRRLQNLLTGLLILAMLFSLLSTTAFAVDPTEAFVAATEKTGTGSIVVTVYDQAPGTAGTGAQITAGLNNPVAGVGINAKKIGSVVELTTTKTDENNTVITKNQVAVGLDSDAVTSLGLSNTAPIAINDGISYFAPTDVQAALSSVSQSDLETYAATNPVASSPVTTTDQGVATFDNLAAGVYLLAKSELPASATTDLAPFLVSVPMYVGDSWEDTVYAYPKVRTETLKLTKATTHADDYVNAGETISYTLEVKIPATGTGTGERPFTTFQVVDTNRNNTLDISNVVVKLAKDSDTNTNLLTSTTPSFTTNDDDQVLTIDLSNDLDKLNDNHTDALTFTVTYDATVATDVAFSSALENTATLTYARSGADITSTDAVTLYTYGIDLTKTLSDSTAITENKIQFALYSNQACTTQINMIARTGAGTGSYWRAADGETPATMYVGPDGHLKLYGLEPGTYYLKETATMDGYTKLDAPIAIVITAPTESGNDPTATVNGTAAQVTGGVVSLSVVNTKTEAGFTLPQTGGNGTLLVTAIGLGLLFLGVILLVAYRRKPRR